MEIHELEQISLRIRKNIIEMLCQAGSGHPGGSLSSVDLLVSLYYTQMNFDPKNPKDPKRDYFVLSKGHGCPTLYSILAEYGCMHEKELCTLRQYGSKLQGHPGMDKGIPGIEVSTGSLGFGLSVAVGMAIGSKMAKRPNRVYALMGDGELQEGSIWEAVMSAGHFKLDNLCGMVDWNQLQIDGKVEDVMGIDPLVDKFRSFRWEPIEIDGHDFKQIIDAFKKAKATKGKPTVILAHTTKGKGVSYMENVCDWHGKTPSQEQADKALNELK
ncbi:MAG: transketolase [Endomicrobiales bacterium]|nr:transketolase [Endomicrobiales bacterium]